MDNEEQIELEKQEEKETVTINIDLSPEVEKALIQAYGSLTLRCQFSYTISNLW